MNILVKESGLDGTFLLVDFEMGRGNRESGVPAAYEHDDGDKATGPPRNLIYESESHCSLFLSLIHENHL